MAKAAYESLIASLEESDVAANATFGVVPFAGAGATSAIGPLDAERTNTTIQGLTTTGGTNYAKALETTETYLVNAPPGATNVVYFLSDGEALDPETGIETAAESLQAMAEVRAFGIGINEEDEGYETFLDNLNTVDSDNAVVLDDPADLEGAFGSAPIDRNTIERVDVLLNGTVVDTILPDQLEPDTLGLTYEGEIEGLEVSKTAENDAQFVVVFNNGAPNVTVETTITSGQEERTVRNADGTTSVTLAAGQTDYVSDLPSATITGNARDNTIEVGDGENTLFGVAGDDVFEVGSGLAVIDGGAGVDTARFDFTQAEAGTLKRTADVVSFGDVNAPTRATLIDVEYAAFTDGLVDLSTLDEVKRLSVERNQVVEVVEDDDGQTYATIFVDLAEPANTSTRIAFATADLTARAGSDYEATSGEITIIGGSADETVGAARIPVNGDQLLEGDESFEVILTAPDDALFAGQQRQASVAVEIKDDDSYVSIPVDLSGSRLIEGDAGASTQEITVMRAGSLDERAVVAYDLAPTGSTPAAAAYFGGTFPSGEVVFEPGQDRAVIAFDLIGNDQPDDGGTFSVALTAVSGDVATPPEPVVYEIVNDDLEATDFVLQVGGASRVDGADDVVGLAPLDALELDTGTIATTFVADDVAGLQGLFSKDARDLGDGGHLSLAIEDGALTARLLAAEDPYVLRLDGIEAGRAYDVALTFDGGDARLYVDGALVDQVSDTGFSLADNREHLQIGALGWASEADDPGAFSNVFTGEIEDVLIFDTALTQAEIGTMTAPDTVLAVDRPLQISSADDVLNFGHFSRLALDEGTIAARFVADDVTGLHSLLSKDARDFGDGGHLSLYVEDGALVARLQDTGTSHLLRYDGIEVGREHDVALAFEAGAAQLYVDGTLADEVSDTGFSLADNREHLQIGALGWASEDDDPDAFTNVFDGRIDDLRLFDRALDPGAVQSLAEAPADDWLL